MNKGRIVSILAGCLVAIAPVDAQTTTSPGGPSVSGSGKETIVTPVMQTPVTDRIPFRTEHHAADWKPAFWIHCQAATEEKHPYSLFRREFDLASRVVSAVLHVATDDRYRVSVNGTIVANGSTPHDYVHMSYESYEIASLLRSGNNVLAFEVMTQAPERTISDEHKLPSGVIAAVLEVGEDRSRYRTLVATDAGWASAPGRGWLVGVGKSTLMDLAEVFNSGMAFRDWQSVGFRDARWNPARILKPVQEDGDKSGTRQPLQTMMPRPMPQLARAFVPAKSVVEAGEVVCFQSYSANEKFPAVKALTEQMRPARHCRIEGVENLLRQDAGGPCVIENEFGERGPEEIERYWKRWEDRPLVRHASMILDMGDLMNGYFALEVDGQPGAIIDISYDQTLTDGRVVSVPLVNWNELGGTVGQLFKTDRLILRGGRQSWTGFQLRHLRYVQLTFRNLGGPLRLIKFGVIKEELPYAPYGAFRCSDAVLNRLWEADYRTLHAVVHNIPVDNMTREKSPWGGDCSAVVYSALALHGDLPVLQHYLRVFRWTQGESGAALNKAWVPRFHPKAFFNEHRSNFPFHIVLQSDAFADYAKYSGDAVFKREVALPLLKGQIDWTLARLDANGLIRADMKFWYDWAPLPPLGTSNFVGNAIFVQVLEKTAELLGGEDPRAARYRLVAERIRTVLARDFWVPERGLYSDALQEGRPMAHFSEHGAIYALALGLTGDGRREKLLGALRRNAKGSGELIEFNLVFARFAWENLFEVEPSLGLELMRKRYGWALREGATTIPEEWSAPYLSTRNPERPIIHYRAMAQSANGAPSFFLLTRLLGVRPLTPGFSTFLVAPEPCDLAWAEGAMPSPHGLIPVRWEKKGNEFRINVTVPEGAKANVRLPDRFRPFTLNGKRVSDGPIHLVAGEYEIVGRP